ncbi:DNA gyrase inhibitor YacG [Neisseriaceae bacterium JH1-16]|nr:DNA gyrase inhibitor YacG [Neisseriaceae bacterium JH1-16]
MSSSTPRQVTCPTCKTLIDWTPENRFRPFCSERCKLIDLGQWATEQYRVAAEEDDLDELTRNSLN